MVKVDKSKPVLVTGATGYVAGWIVKRLLDEGVTVHAAVRNPSDKAKVEHLVLLANNSPGKLIFFKADLLDHGSYKDAMAGCEVVIHTASPFVLHINDAQKDLVTPAVEGTRNVLDTANQTASVKRIVLTSSCAAIYGDTADKEFIPGGTFTEAHWNTSSSLKHQPYSFSKTMAEKLAWEISYQQNRWRLVVINPSFVLGPGIIPHANSESFNLLRQVGNGRLKAGLPDIGVGAIDVRDLADAHIRAAYLPNANGRHIISGQNTSLLEIARTLQHQYNEYPIPSRTLPKWLIWLIGPLADQTTTRKFVARNVGYSWHANNEKSIRELGMTYRPLDETVNAMFQQLIDHGQIPRPKRRLSKRT
jgi:nucleoside-diphosphate-sugar epimerase